MLEKPRINKKHIKINRALVSVFDKTGLPELGRSLEKLGIEILSTGGSAQALRDAGVSVTDVSDYTKFPENLRVNKGNLKKYDKSRFNYKLRTTFHLTLVTFHL